jgi:hypothetical protein
VNPEHARFDIECQGRWWRFNDRRWGRDRRLDTLWAMENAIPATMRWTCHGTSARRVIPREPRSSGRSVQRAVSGML